MVKKTGFDELVLRGYTKFLQLAGDTRRAIMDALWCPMSDLEHHLVGVQFATSPRTDIERLLNAHGYTLNVKHPDPDPALHMLSARWLSDSEGTHRYDVLTHRNATYVGVKLRLPSRSIVPSSRQILEAHDRIKDDFEPASLYIFHFSSEGLEFYDGVGEYFEPLSDAERKQRTTFRL